ncbi:MAG TPA: exosortase-associated EpsI family protein [Verrucomicrobiae bacterium]|jgi:hypothetical protein|nr:exosortase-associated EpsI family protein [Verrucomicrobiae bacterium]
MNKQARIMFGIALMMMVMASTLLKSLKGHQKLGAPGLITSVIPDSKRLKVFLPEKVLDYDSIMVPTDTNVLEGLPHDTSFAQRRFLSPDKNSMMLLNVVLMGADRTSIHKPQFCLAGSGWDIDASESHSDTVRVESPHPYDLPVMRLLSTRLTKGTGEDSKRIRGIYVYWFVADHDLTSSHVSRMWKTTTHLLRTGELERWAYVSCFSVCWPGEEEATYARMKKFIADAVPKFQLSAGPQVAAREPEQTASR